MNKTLMASATWAAATHTGESISAEGFTGVRVFLVYTGGTGSAVVKLQTHAGGGEWVDLPGASFAALATTSTKTLSVYPGVATSTNVSVSDVIGSAIRAVATVSTTTATFGVYADLLH